MHATVSHYILPSMIDVTTTLTMGLEGNSVLGAEARNERRLAALGMHRSMR